MKNHRVRQLIVPILWLVFSFPNFVLGQETGRPNVFQQVDLDAKRQREQEDLRRFAALPPKERVEALMKLWDTVGERDETNDVIRSSGAAVVPFLIKEIKASHPKTYRRLNLILFLCHIDRFEKCTAENLDCISALTVVDADKKRLGAVSPYRIVDGRIIGKEGLHMVRWAATQKDDDVLQTFALIESGFLEAEARALPMAELVGRWKKAIHDNHRFWFPDFYADRIYFQLSKVIRDRPDEALPYLVKLVNPETNEALLHQTLKLILWIDSTSMRLRGTEVGRSAISAMDRLFAQGILLKDVIEAESHQREKELILSRFKSDENFPIFQILQGLESVYGLSFFKTVNSYRSVEFLNPVEVQEFLAFLTKVDPYFPGWEFPGVNEYNQSLHPNFRKKLARFYEDWNSFQAERQKNRPAK
jgi:hypothetical protein